MEVDRGDISKTFDVLEVMAALKGNVFGKRIIFKDTVGSTNVLLKELAKEGAAEGTVVIADEQTAGLGRMGRKWFSPKGENLLLSILMRPDLAPDELFILTMIFALSGIDAVYQVSGLKVGIKWPNDIYIGPKKLGGVLTEFSVLENKIEYAVLGMGLNVNWNPAPEIISGYGTSSLFGETGRRISRERLAGNLLINMARYYGMIAARKGKWEFVFERWNENSVLMGKTVRVETDKEQIEGKAVGIDRDGALSVVTAGGVRKIRVGDVSVKVKDGRE